MARASKPARSHLAIVRRDLASEVEADRRDRRVDPRLTLSELAWLTAVRLKYGPIVSLVDLSAGGAQIETSTRLQPGTTIVLEIARPEGDISIPSNVLRSSVCRVTPQAIYRSALSFKRPFAPPQPSDTGRADAVANLVAEHARMSSALRKLTHTRGDTRTGTLAGETLLTSTLGLIQAPAGRRAEGRFRQHLTQVLRQLTVWIEAGAEPGTMLPRLTERLRRAVPARTIGIWDGASSSGPHGRDTVYFEAVNETGDPTRLIVEFPADCALEEWHFQFLRVAAQLVALVKEIEHVFPVAPLASALSAPSLSENADAALTPWMPVVARYLDGRMVKGYCRGFWPSRGFVQISPAPDAAPSSVVTVPMRQLKALFFVHDLERAPLTLEPAAAPRGRNIEVTFTDGEVLAGTTLNYTSDGPGFFLSPRGEGSNNQRVYVTTAAVHYVRFP